MLFLLHRKGYTKASLIIFLFTVAMILLWQASIFMKSTPTEYGISTLVSSNDAPRLFNPNWNLDGTALIVTSQELIPGGYGHLYTIDLMKGSMWRITNSDNGFYDHAVWSPDSNHVAFWSNTTTHDGISIINMKNLETNFIVEGHFVSWSHNNELAVADVLSSDTSRLAIVNIMPLDGDMPVTIFEAKANYPVFTDIIWSPDGNYIAFGVNLGNDLTGESLTTLFIVDKKGDIKLQLVDQGIDSISWTPDSEGVIYFHIVKSTQISRFKLVTFKGKCIEFQTSIWPMGRPKFSFDGTKIAFSSLDSKIYVADTKSIFGEGFWDNGSICQ